MKQRIGLAARMALGLVFLASGLEKASLPPQEFAAVVDAYQLLRPDQALAFATLVPWIEILAGLALLTGYLTRLASAVTGGLLISFIGALASTLIRHMQLESCGCFGGGLHLTPPQALGLDACLVLLAALAFRHGRHLASLDNWIERGE